MQQTHSYMQAYDAKHSDQHITDTQINAFLLKHTFNLANTFFFEKIEV